MSFLTGSPGKSTSVSDTQSGNKAYPWIQQNFGASGAGAFNQGTSAISSLLGLGGDPAASKAALNNWWNSAGGQFQLGEGLDALTNKYSSMGLYNSGAAAKAMEKYRQGLASTYLQQYLGNLGDLSKLGLGAGGLVTQAGQYSTGHSESKSTGQTEGLGGLLGSLLAVGAAASDIRLKKNIVFVGELADGLPVAEFDYDRELDPTLPRGRHRGVMAQDVARLRPWALGPERNGYATVNYLLLGE
jgi:hypothetical protein